MPMNKTIIEQERVGEIITICEEMESYSQIKLEIGQHGIKCGKVDKNSVCDKMYAFQRQCVIPSIYR